MEIQFRFIGVVVDDMARSLAFYRRLGLDIPAASDAEPHVECDLPGGVKLVWDTVATIRSFDPAWTAPVGGARMALAFTCASPAEVDRVHGDLAEFSHRAPWDAFWGQRYAVLHDPDGNAVDLLATL